MTTFVATDALERAGRMARLRAWMHLGMCVNCRRYAKQLRLIADRVRALSSAATSEADIRRMADEITRSILRRE